MDASASQRTTIDAVVRVARWILIVAGALALAPVVASLLLRQVSIASPWAVAYVAATPFVPIAGGVAVVLFLLARCWTGVATAAAITVVLLLTQVPLFLGTPRPDGPTTTVIVMTVNMHYGLGDASQIVETARRHDVDVLALQELTTDAMGALRAAGLDDLLPHSHATPAGGASGNGLWSRFPLEPLPGRPGFGHPPVAATMDLDGRPVFLAAVHPVSPYPDDTAEWVDELAALADWLGSVDGPAIVAGDFNSTPDHRQFRDVLATGYRDAGEQVGSGYMPTYPSNRRRIPRLVAIDHVITSGGIVATELTRIPVDGSDHQGLVTVLAVPDAGFANTDP